MSTSSRHIFFLFAYRRCRQCEAGIFFCEYIFSISISYRAGHIHTICVVVVAMSMRDTESEH